MDAMIEARDLPRGPLVLSRPLIAVLLAVWVINDHVLKAAYGTWWTGKLSDLVGLIVFPLLVAAAVERFVRRPVAFGIGFTGIFFGAINLWAPADAATEWLMSLAVRSELTPDPTDVILLPVMLVSYRIWQRPPTSWRTIRLAWGRTVFGLGALTSMATSPPVEIAEVQAGTFVLTAAEPSVEIPVSLTLDGEQAENLSPLEVGWSLAFFGEDPGPYFRDAVSVETVDDGDGSGTVVFNLNEPTTSPVEVQWRISAAIWGDGGFVLFGGGPAEPAVSLDPPPDEFGPDPIATVPVQGNYDASLFIWEAIVEADADTLVRLSLPTVVSESSIRIATEDQASSLQPGFGTSIGSPESCTTQRCTFSVWIAHDANPLRFTSLGEADLTDPSVAVRIDGPDDIVLVDLIAHEPVLTSRSFVTEMVEWTTPSSAAFAARLELPVPVDPVERATSFFRVETAPIVEYRSGDASDLHVFASTEIGTTGRSPYKLVPTENCCEPLNVELATRQGFNDAEHPDVAITVELRVEMWTLRPPTSEIKLTFE